MPYVPRTDAGLDQYAENFASVIETDPAVYGLTAGDASQIRSAVDAYRTAYALAVDPSTRTPSTVASKDAERANVVATIRQYAQLIQATGGITDQQKADLGITIRDTTPTPVPAPETAPVLGMAMMGILSHRLRFHDENTQLRKKPFGVVAVELYAQVGMSAGIDPADATFIAPVSAWPHNVNWNAEHAGKTATYWARYRTARGLTGPWSAALALTIPTGSGLPNGGGGE